MIADALSRANIPKFRQLAPIADILPVPIPMEFWNLLKMEVKSLLKKYMCQKVHGMYMKMQFNLLKDLEINLG